MVKVWPDPKLPDMVSAVLVDAVAGVHEQPGGCSAPRRRLRRLIRVRMGSKKVPIRRQLSKCVNVAVGRS